MMKRLACAGLWIVLGMLSTSAQVNLNKKCSGRVFSSQEVTKAARILKGPNLSIAHGLLEPGMRRRLVIEAVLCRSGHVTDIRVTEGVSAVVDEFASAAVSMVEFEPAEFRWHSVSQLTRFEFGPNEPGIRVSTSAGTTGRLVESVDIIGNRRLTAKEIFSWIQTRPGNLYREQDLKRDFDAILATGYFDKTQTRAMIEDGIRGGVRVIFEVVELPVIGEVNFENLEVERSVVLAALKKEQIDLQPGKPYDVATVKRAARIIKLVIAEIGQTNSNVETKVENVSATRVNITFVITPIQ